MPAAVAGARGGECDRSLIEHAAGKRGPYLVAAGEEVDRRLATRPCRRGRASRPRRMRDRPSGGGLARGRTARSGRARGRGSPRMARRQRGPSSPLPAAKPLTSALRASFWVQPGGGEGVGELVCELADVDCELATLFARGLGGRRTRDGSSNGSPVRPRAPRPRAAARQRCHAAGRSSRALTWLRDRRSAAIPTARVWS